MADSDLDLEIREIKREIIESRGLVIKTNNLTSTLGSDIKTIAKRQAGYERKLTINSAVAYVLTIGVVFVGAYVASDQRARRYETQRQAVEQENHRLEAELEKAQTAQSARVAAVQKATKLGELIDRGEREEFVAELGAIDREELSPLEVRYLEETSSRFRTELSMRAFQEGLEHARAKRYGDAVTAFERSLDLQKTNGHTARVRLHMADALRLQGKRAEAIAVLRELLDSELLDRELVAESRWNLALCFAETSKRDESRRELLYIINKFPQSHWARIARKKLLEVNAMR